VSIDLTSSWTDATASVAASTGAAVTAGAVATPEGAAVVATPEGAAFLAATFFSAAGAATGATGAAATGAAVAAGAFFVTVLADLVAVEAAELIIPDAVEEFMAGIRTYCAKPVQFLVNSFRYFCIFFEFGFFSLKSSHRHHVPSTDT